MGKWTLGRDGENACMIYEGAEPVAQVYGLWMHSALSTLEEAARLNPKSYAVPLARARLIAAAPALYDALHEMAEIYWGVDDDKNGDGISPPPKCIVRARAALASAKVTRGDET